MPQKKHDHTGQGTNWTLIGVLAIVAIACVAIVGMMRPDSFKTSGGKDGYGIEIRKESSGK